jgi:hypothetical protein
MQGAQNKRPPMKKEVTPKTQGAQYKRPPIKKRQHRTKVIPQTENQKLLAHQSQLR